MPEDSPPETGRRSPPVRRYLVAFGHFWWEFLVGDTPELLVGVVLAVGLVALFAHHGVARAVTVASLPVLVVLMLGALGSSRVDLQACKLEYSIVSPK